MHSQKEIFSLLTNLLKQNSTQCVDRIINVDECASLINRSTTYLRNNIRKNPSAFPRPLLSGKKCKLQWKLSTVLEWIASQPEQRRALRGSRQAVQ